MLELNQEHFEPVIDETIKINSLNDEAVLSLLGTGTSPSEIRSCVGDIYKIVNMLMDYARLLELAVVQWDLQAFHKAKYEYHSEQCRKIASKYAVGIGYDYEKAVERCRRKQKKGVKDNDIGEEAMVIAAKKNGEVKKK